MVCLFSFSAVSFADDDGPIPFSRLPQKAQGFIENHFAYAQIQKVVMDENGDEYEVRMTGNIKIEFGKAGRWKEIEAKHRGVPAGIVPRHIMHKVRKQYGTKVRIMEISRDEDEIEVKLSNGKELEFDRNRKNRDDD